MSEKWVRMTLTAELLSDAQFGSGSGGNGIDSLIARDRRGYPVIWSSHVEGVLRDAARRLGRDEGAFFGRPGGEQQRAMFTSLYAKDNPESRIWRSTARAAFDNRAPKDDALRVIEYVPKGQKLVGEVELPASQLETLKRLLQEVDALGGGRATGAGRVKLTLADLQCTSRKYGAPTRRLVLLLKNRDPLCITATATPDNLIPSLAFVPGRTLLGAVAAWLIAEGDPATASLLTSGKVSVSDGLPLPNAPLKVEGVEVLPAPLSLQSEKPKGEDLDNSSGSVPWWAQPTGPAKRLDAWSSPKKLKRPEDDLFVFRENASSAWSAFRPGRRVRLRNGRPDPKQPDASLFAIEQIVEDTHLLAELHGEADDLKKLAEKLAPVLEGQRWLRVGRAGAPVEVASLAWLDAPAETTANNETLLTLTSDLLVHDEHLRWRTALDEQTLRALVGTEDISIVKTERGELMEQDTVMVHGFNGTSRLWRMPAAAVRRGSVFKVSGTGIAKLVERATKNDWLGERTHEGFGRFRLDSALPGTTIETSACDRLTVAADVPEEVVAMKTQEWFSTHQSLANAGGGSERKPSLSQWLDLVGELERDEPSALTSRIDPKSAGSKSWKYGDARAILDKLNDRALQPKERARHARLFVRWLRADLRAKSREA